MFLLLAVMKLQGIVRQHTWQIRHTGCIPGSTGAITENFIYPKHRNGILKKNVVTRMSITYDAHNHHRGITTKKNDIGGYILTKLQY
jgi:hypothetical protein